MMDDLAMSMHNNFVYKKAHCGSVMYVLFGLMSMS